MIIAVTVKNKRAELAAPAVIVCRNTDYKINFVFDDEWAGHDVKTARFCTGGNAIEVVFTGNVCAVPEMVDVTGVNIGVYSGDLITTTAAYIPCEKSILDIGGGHVAPPVDVYNQLVALAEETRQTAASANASAGNAVQTANAAKETADSVTAAEHGRTEAELQRSKAEAQRSEAEQGRATAEQGRETAETNRNTAEQTRATAEAQRTVAEQGRATAEQSRVTSETERQEAINEAAPSIVISQTGEFITVKDAAKRTVKALKVAGKTAEGGKSVKEGTVIRSTGKNFAKISADSTRSAGSLTVTFTENNNTCIVNGIVDGSNSFATTYRAMLSAGTYTASVIGLNSIDSRNDRIYIFDANTREIYINYITSRQAGTFTIAEACEVGITFVFATGSAYNSAQIRVQIEAGPTASAIEEPVSGSEIITPCHLFDGDAWFPLSGTVERSDGTVETYGPQVLSACYGVTNITQTPAELTATLYVDYVADTKLYIDHRLFNAS